MDTNNTVTKLTVAVAIPPPLDEYAGGSGLHPFSGQKRIPPQHLRGGLFDPPAITSTPTHILLGSSLGVLKVGTP